MLSSAAVLVTVVPLIDSASVSNVPSTSTSPEMSREATTAVPVSVGAVNVLFVRVCEPVNVATVLSIDNVTPVPDAAESIPVPPRIPKDSESRSISIDVEPSVTSKSCAVTCEST